MRTRTYLLGSVLGAASLTLALALTGCGRAADSGTADTEEAVEAEAEATEDEAAGDEDTVEFQLPEDLDAIAKVLDATSEEGDEQEAVDLTSLPTSDEESVVEDKSEIKEDDGDASKASSNTRVVTYGGMSFNLPYTWQGRKSGDDYLIMSLDGYVAGHFECLKVKGKYDVVRMAEAFPYGLSNEGYTNVEVVDYGTGTSSKGNTVDAFIMVAFTGRSTRYVAYREILQSKNYITTLTIMGEASDWNKNAGDIATIANSVCFAPGEAW